MASYKYDDTGELGNDHQQFGTNFEFTEKSIRLGFIRKVYGILCVQLMITLGFIALFLYTPSVQKFSAENPALMISSMVVTFVAIIVLACCENMRRKAPGNFIILGIFTLCESWMLGAIASRYESWEVMAAVGIVAVITLALTIFALQSKWDFTAMGGALLVVLVVLLMFGFMAIFMQNRVVNIVYASLGALVFGLYLVFDTQLMLGGKHKYSISPEEYIFAALNLYLDIINMFIYILAIFGNSRS